jgi:hypothetical protein
MSDINTPQSPAPPAAVPSPWTKKLQISAGVAILAVIAIIVAARVITYGDLPGCDSRNAKDALSDIFKRGKLDFSRYIEVKTLKKTDTEITCFASLAKSAGGSAEFDYRIYSEDKVIKVQITRGEDKP